MDIAKVKNIDIMTMKGMSGERLADILWRKEVENWLFALSHSIVTCGDFGRLNVDERRKNCYMNNRCFVVM